MDKDASSVHHCHPQQQFRHHQWWPSTLPSSTCACWTFRDSYQIRSLLWHLSCWPCRLVKEILSNQWTSGQLILEGLTNPTWGNFKCETWKGEKWKYTNTKRQIQHVMTMMMLIVVKGGWWRWSLQLLCVFAQGAKHKRLPFLDQRSQTISPPLANPTMRGIIKQHCALIQTSKARLGLQFRTSVHCGAVHFVVAGRQGWQIPKLRRSAP